MGNLYGEIPPLIEITNRCDMTVGELLAALGEYPSDSTIRVCMEDAMRPMHEIKEVSPIYDQDTGRASPMLIIGKITVTPLPSADSKE
ncbi:hypothetical protein LJC63_11985 [Ruminococcaceae bacterium OttesenSCG-928-L11]|nr:hypothetical protein [Ruminococcaceae bacterium OttesenSCG-928-L11]